MNSEDRDIWFQIGYALESVRHAVPGRTSGGEGREGGRRSSGRRSRRRGREEDRGGSRRTKDGISGLLSDMVLRRGTRSLGPLALAALPLRKSVGMLHLLGAGACGAAASVLVDSVASWSLPDRTARIDPDDLSVVALAGAGRGITYGGVVEPRLPGPAYLLGIVYGTAEYLAGPVGGLSSLLGRAAPQRKLPFLADLLGADEDHDPRYVEHVLFGLVLAMLYDSLRAKRGTTDGEE